jgi:sortase A
MQNDELSRGGAGAGTMKSRFFLEPRVYRHSLFGWRRSLSGRETWRASLERALLCAGAILLGWCGWTLAQGRAYQGYESWSLDRMRAGRPATVGGYLASRVIPERGSAPLAAVVRAARTAEAIPLRRGDLVGRLAIPRLHLSAIVLEGDDDGTLKLGVGHVPGTALPGSAGNVALAAHRDSYFRPLRGIHPADEIEMTTPQRTFRYRVDSVRIVDPGAVEVLRDSAGPTLTLVTCYPFGWVGNAPKRFIVRASRVETN